MQTINFPSINELILRNFSLYSEPEVKISFNKPVTCIMGANGIGKSTLLNCINYAITGYISQPNRKVLSVNDFLESNSYHIEYFDGRISELDKDFAEVSIEYTLNAHSIYVKRRFFPSNKVVEFLINGVEANDYEGQVKKLAGVSQFSQFAFMQLKVLSFDEARECLFWNSNLLTPALFVCMGSDAETAKKADTLSREIQKLNSRFRNLQWEITKQQKRLMVLIEEKEKTDGVETSQSMVDIASLNNEYEELQIACEEHSNLLIDLQSEQSLISGKLSEQVLLIQLLEDNFKELYKRAFNSRIDIIRNPLLAGLSNGPCPVCGFVHEIIPSYTSEAIARKECPLCGEALPTEETTIRDMDELSSLDKKLQNERKRYEELQLRQESLNKKNRELMGIIAELKERINKIDADIVAHKNNESGDDAWNKRIETLREAISYVDEEKKKVSEDREKLKQEYDVLFYTFRNQYENAQEEFLPTFKLLAYQFTGLDLDIRLQSNTEENRMVFKFSLQIGDSHRNDIFELSESQRFFIDIALRMSLIIYTSKNSKNCTMLIDTPEGSLDIAYETNAGAMFAQYVNQGHNLILTANLNSSGLIRTLAAQTGKDSFRLENMLRWSNLSIVQSRHAELFEDAIRDIEDRLE